MCLNPKWIYKKGNYKQDNYRGSAGDFYELGTFSKCGSCQECINEKSGNWVVRNYFESINPKNDRKCFITLTYKENPIIIVQKDFQDFIKRLRINLDRTTGEKIRTFTALEYGEKNNRPHGHIIIYGWDDKEPEYLDINEKGNLYYKSKIIDETWGKGRTSYQKFDDKEIPYLSLYNTAQDTFKRAYKMNMNRLKNLEQMANQLKDTGTRKNLMQELNEARIELETSKKEYLVIKEKNLWSKSMGWEMFEKEFYNSKNFAFEHYFGELTFATPSSWVKKLANSGSIEASEEMFRREKDRIKETNEHREKMKNQAKIDLKKKEEILEFHDDKRLTTAVL